MSDTIPRLRPEDAAPWANTLAALDAVLFCFANGQMPREQFERLASTYFKAAVTTADAYRATKGTKG